MVAGRLETFAELGTGIRNKASNRGTSSISGGSQDQGAGERRPRSGAPCEGIEKGGILCCGML